MTRDEWNQVLETEPATPNQRGAVMGEFERLGVTDRSERLAACAAVLGLGELDSTHSLTMGEAGQLLSALRGTRTRADLPAVPDARPAPWAALLGQTVTAWWPLLAGAPGVTEKENADE